MYTSRRFVALFLVLLAVSPVFTQPPNLTGYHNYIDLSKRLHDMREAYPDLIKLESLGKTLESRDIWLVTLGNLSSENPAIALVGGIEGDDVASSELCLRFIESAARAFNVVDSVRTILDRITYYIIPRVNPDAAEQLWDFVAYDRLLNSRPVDLDFDGAVNEDGFDDLNGDGFITLMRVADPAGEWIEDAQQPQLMRKAEPEKQKVGAFRLLSEGLDNDKDGFWNEDPVGGVNFNENFSFFYKPFTDGAGPHPISELETRAVADFFFAHENITLVFGFSQNENLYHPRDAAKESDMLPRKPITKVLPDDSPYYKYIADQFKEQTGFTNPPKAERESGAFTEWVYFHYGRWSFSAPAWYPPLVSEKEDSIKNAQDDPIAKKRRLYNWIEKEDVPYFVEWTKVDHPDFPDQTVEIGGFVPGVSKNPPVDSLDYFSEKFSAFFYQLANYLPKLTIHPKVESLSEQLFRITLTIKNSGYLPTSSALGGKSKWVRKVKAELELPDQYKIVSGFRFYLLDPISDSAHEQTWLVMGKKNGRIKVVAESPSVGRLEKDIILR